VTETNGQGVTGPDVQKILFDAALETQRATAAELARTDVASARTETARAVDAAKIYASVIGLLAAAALGSGSTVIGNHGGLVGGGILVAAGGMLLYALERCVAVIQARIGTATPDSPGWYGVCGLKLTGHLETDDLLLDDHYMGRAKNPVVAYARETLVIGPIARVKHLTGKRIARVIRIALLLAPIGAVLAALHI
jgi:hypothetical protein